MVLRGVQALCLLVLICPCKGALPSSWNASGGKFAYYRDSSLWIVDVASGNQKALANVNADSACHVMWPAASASVVWACPHSLTRLDSHSGRSKVLLASPSPIIDPQPSPDGKTIAFVRDHIFSSIPVNGGPVRPLLSGGTANLLVAELDPLYAHEFHMDHGYWWSPDSTSIVYLETDRTDAGVYPQAGKPLPVIKLKLLVCATRKMTEIAAATAEKPYLAGIAWLPDSKQLTYQMLNRLQNQLDMSLYNSAAAVSKQIYSEKDAYWINLPGSPIFTASGDKFLIASERTGSRHIYLYSIDGRLESDLTPGKIEVTGPFLLDSAQRLAYFSALTGTMRDLQLFRVGFDGKGPELITRDAGWHETAVSPDRSSFVDSFSTATQTPALSVNRMDGSRIAELTKTSPPAHQAPEFFEIKLHDSVELPTMMWKPAGFDPLKKYPVIVYTFSGPEGHVVKNSWGGWQDDWNRAMADKGYVMVAVDARGSGGYGHYFEEYIHYRFGAQEVADLREVFSYLSRLQYVDPKRIGIWGCGYGAHTVVHGLLDFPNGFAAGFADSPITDWHFFNAYFTERYLGLPARRITEYNDSSSLDNGRRLHAKLLVASSPADSLIPSDQVKALQTALDKAKKTMETISFPNANYHDDAASLATLMKRMTDFFAASL